jgi:hypothetical protein
MNNFRSDFVFAADLLRLAWFSAGLLQRRATGLRIKP